MRYQITHVLLFATLFGFVRAPEAVAQRAGAVRRLPEVETTSAAVPTDESIDMPIDHPADTSIDVPTASYEEATWSEAFLAGPSVWFDREIWEGGVELGINGSEGNAQSLSFRAGSKLKRTTARSLLALDLAHARTKSDSTETQNNATFNARHDWLFGESPWTIFAATSLEYDEFKAFDLRTAANAGIGYQFIKHDTTQLTGRVGSGFSHEIGGPDDSYVPEAVFGLDFEHQLTKRQKLIAKTDFFPDWSDYENYRIETTLGWEILLDEEANLSLKLGIVDRYDSTPNGRKHNDFDYSLLLIWKL